MFQCSDHRVSMQYLVNLLQIWREIQSSHHVLSPFFRAFPTFVEDADPWLINSFLNLGT